jgi:hypothetical protein
MKIWHPVDLPNGVSPNGVSPNGVSPNGVSPKAQFLERFLPKANST